MRILGFSTSHKREVLESLLSNSSLS